MAFDQEIRKQLRNLQKAYETSSLSEAAGICNNLGIRYAEIGKWEKALRYHREELQLSESLKDKLGIAVAHRMIGESLASLCQFKESLKHQKEYLEIAEAQDNLEEVQRAYATIGRIHYMKYKAEGRSSVDSLVMARNAFTDSLSKCDELESAETVRKRELSEMRTRLYLNLGLLSEESNNKSSAEEYYQLAIRLGKEAGSHEIVWHCYSNLAEMFLQQKYPNRALSALKEGLKHAQTGKKDCKQSASTFVQMATVHVYLKEFSSAKQCLKSAIKLKCLDDDELEKASNMYRIIRKILCLQSEAEERTPDQIITKIKLYEQLGDICAHSEVGFYSAAIHFYSVELKLAEDHGLEPKEISKIYFSLAETLVDNRQFSAALGYYNKELELWSSYPAESAATWANIARVHEAAGEDEDKIMESYDTAISLAKTSKDPKVLFDVYQSLLVYCQENPDMEAKRRLIQSKMTDIEELHPEVSQKVKNDSQFSPLTSCDLAEELLSSSSSEEEEDATSSQMPSSYLARELRGAAVRHKSRVMKRNEKGETLLHVAAIEGNLSRVKQLLQDGADVTARDYCGWTPLHEACNHGYTTIVEHLLDYGADINDSGGVHCNGTTSLMDAAINGHVETVLLLIERKANVALRNSKGQTALALVEHCLAGHKSHTHSKDRYELAEEHTTIRNILRQEMANVRTVKTVQKSTTRDADQARERDLLLTQFQVDKNPLGTWEDDASLGDSSLDSCGSHSQRPVAVVNPFQSRSQDSESPALIPEVCFSDDSFEKEQENAVVDNWLVDDMGPPAKKKRKGHTGHDLVSTSNTRSQTSGSCRRTKQASSKQQIQQQSSANARAARRDQTGVLDEVALPKRNDSRNQLEGGIFPEEHRSTFEELSDDNEDHFGDRGIPPNEPDMYFPLQLPMDCHPQCTLPTSSIHVASLPASVSTLRVKVMVEGVSYLVPCPMHQEDGSYTTVKWLASNMADRYFTIYGKRPILQMLTAEGSLLCGTDSIMDVLQEGEEVQGVVDRWEIPVLGEHYQTICSKSKTACHSQVLQVFRSNPSPLVLNLSHMGIQSQHASPLFHSLIPQTTLTSLMLAGNRLLDSSIQPLSSTLPYLTSLHTLDLTCIGMTHRGLEVLACLSSKSLVGHESSLNSLRHLILSHNQLGPTSGSSLASLFSKCAGLTHLCLEDCGLTSYTLESHTGLTAALQELSGLTELSLACNQLGGEGHHLLMNALDRQKLASLNLACTWASHLTSSPPVLCSEWHINSIVNQVGASLSRLYLSGCAIGDLQLSALTVSLLSCTLLKELYLAMNDITLSGAEALSRILEQSMCLRMIDLSGNTNMGNRGCLSVIQSCGRVQTLKQLKLVGCGMSSPLPDHVWQGIDLSSLTLLDLSDNTLDERDRTSILECLTDAHVSTSSSLMFVLHCK